MTTTCARCHRPLTDPNSIRAGMGPECRAQLGITDDRDLCVHDQFSDVFDSSTLFSEALVLGRQPRINSFFDINDLGIAVTNIPHLVVQHSPDGYEYGYGGSGPADLALNICQLYLNMTGYEGERSECWDGQCWHLAFAIHQEFKRAFIAGAKRTGEVIPFERINAWFQEHITSELLTQYSRLEFDHE